MQVAVISSGSSKACPVEVNPPPAEFVSMAQEQRKAPELLKIIQFLETEELPQEERRVKRIALQKSLFAIVYEILHYLDPKKDHRK